jgi:flagellar protein FlbT
MKSSIRISLRNGERIFVNGAVLQTDRKVSLALLNDAIFLLESQVMQVEDATTPLRQLYFIVQMMLMTPAEMPRAIELCSKHLQALREACESAEILSGLRVVENLIVAGRYFESLKTIRNLFAVERQILETAQDEPPIRAA